MFNQRNSSFNVITLDPLLIDTIVIKEYDAGFYLFTRTLTGVSIILSLTSHNQNTLQWYVEKAIVEKGEEDMESFFDGKYVSFLPSLSRDLDFNIISPGKLKELHGLFGRVRSNPSGPNKLNTRVAICNIGKDYLPLSKREEVKGELRETINMADIVASIQGIDTRVIITRMPNDSFTAYHLRLSPNQEPNPSEGPEILHKVIYNESYCNFLPGVGSVLDITGPGKNYLGHSNSQDSNCAILNMDQKRFRKEDYSFLYERVKELCNGTYYKFAIKSTRHGVASMLHQLGFSDTIQPTPVGRGYEYTDFGRSHIGQSTGYYTGEPINKPYYVPRINTPLTNNHRLMGEQVPKNGDSINDYSNKEISYGMMKHLKEIESKLDEVVSLLTTSHEETSKVVSTSGSLEDIIFELDRYISGITMIAEHVIVSPNGVSCELYDSVMERRTSFIKESVVTWCEKRGYFSEELDALLKQGQEATKG